MIILRGREIGNARLRHTERSVSHLERSVYLTPSFGSIFWGVPPKLIGANERFARFGETSVYRTPSCGSIFLGAPPNLLGVPQNKFAPTLLGVPPN